LFGKLTDSFRDTVNKIRFADDEKALKNALLNLKKSLLKADVYHSVVKELLANIEKETRKSGIGKDNFIISLRKNLEDILTASGNYGFVYANKPPTVILMSGLQGSGKTTTCGKLANYLKLRDKKVLIAGADLQRLAATEQLKQIGEQIDVDVYIEDGAKDSVKIAKNALLKAKKSLYDVLIIDTAGRLAIDKELMSELSEIKKAVSADELFYVADSLTGQDAVRTANTFNEEIGISGVIFSKYDGDAKGGIAISIAKQIGVPLRFIGTGEKMPDLEVFIPNRIVNRLMGSGDLEGLAEKTSAVLDEKEIKKTTAKIKKGNFNFNDFLSQLESMKKLGSMKSIMSMIPGASGMMKNLENMDLENSDEIKMTKAMIYSMTSKERENPSLLNNSRKRRISKGAGLDIVDVNRSIKQFKNAAKMAKKLSGNKNGNMEDMMRGLQSGSFPR
jgi:signal recognition particle subunit SRP54